MTIGRKLTTAFAAMAAGAALVTFVSQGTVQVLRREMSGAVNGTARRQYLASVIGAATSEMAGVERGIALSSILQQAGKVEAYKRQYQAAAAQLEKAVADYRALAGPDSRAGIDSLAAKADSLQQAHRELISLLSAQQMDAALKAFDERVLPRVVDVSAAGASLVEQENAALARASGSVESQAAGSFWISFVLLAVLAAVSVAVLAHGFPGKRCCWRAWRVACRRAPRAWRARPRRSPAPAIRWRRAPPSRLPPWNALPTPPPRSPP